MIQLLDSMYSPTVPYFAKYCIDRGATVVDLSIPVCDPRWPGYNNPSVLYDRGELKLILRNVNFIQHFVQHPDSNWSDWGPVHYIIPEDENPYLKTQNYICSVDPERGITSYKLVDTTTFDRDPEWEFVGHEDARLVRWNDKLYMTGVRRDDDTTHTGIGRMSLCEVVDGQEVGRLKIDDEFLGYCEKNWMPILDQPYHYVRHVYPTTQIVKVDPNTGKCEIVKEIDQSNIVVDHDMHIRGSSQVVPWGDKYIALTHVCTLFLTERERKFGRYMYQFVVWDKNWNIEVITPTFEFNNRRSEFSVGMDFHDGKFYIPFSFNDNFSFLLTVNEEVIKDFIYGTNYAAVYPSRRSLINDFLCRHDTDSYVALAKWYYDHRHFAAAYDLYSYALDSTLSEDRYVYRFMMTRSLANLGLRDMSELDGWWSCIDIDDSRPEAYLAISAYYAYRDKMVEAYHYAKMAYKRMDKMSFEYNERDYIYYLLISSFETAYRDTTIDMVRELYGSDTQLMNICDEECKRQINRVL